MLIQLEYKNMVNGLEKVINYWRHSEKVITGVFHTPIVRFDVRLALLDVLLTSVLMVTVSVNLILHLMAG